MNDEIISVVRKEVRHYMRLSCERDIYTINQACFRLNVSRQKFYSVYVNTGKINPLIISGQIMIAKQDIESCISNETRYTKRNLLNY